MSKRNVERSILIFMMVALVAIFFTGIDLSHAGDKCKHSAEQLAKCKQHSKEAGHKCKHHAEGAGEHKGCGETDIASLNSFHQAMCPMHQAIKKGDYDSLEEKLPLLIERKQKLLEASIPDKVKDKEEQYTKAIKKLGKYVDKFASSIASKNEKKINKRFKKMRSQYIKIVNITSS